MLLSARLHLDRAFDVRYIGMEAGWYTPTIHPSSISIGAHFVAPLIEVNTSHLVSTRSIRQKRRSVPGSTYPVSARCLGLRELPNRVSQRANGTVAGQRWSTGEISKSLLVRAGQRGQAAGVALTCARSGVHHRLLRSLGALRVEPLIAHYANRKPRNILRGSFLPACRCIAAFKSRLPSRAIAAAPPAPSPSASREAPGLSASPHLGP